MLACEYLEGLMEKKAPIAFFCRAKPQNADALEIFIDARRIFLGYPVIRDEEVYDPTNLSSCIVHPACSDEEWMREIGGKDNRRMYSLNRNLIAEVMPGSIAVIPRSSSGLVHLGRVVGEFEIVNSPAWGKAYLEMRKRQGLSADDDADRYIADVAQGWRVDEFKPVALSRIPGWLRHSMFGRSMVGRFRNYPLNGHVTAHQALSEILDGPAKAKIEWTLDPEAIKRRLVDNLTANAFENLIVSLLQLEFPSEIWHHTGGPGDGGIDGIGSNEQGDLVGLMQAKLEIRHAPGIGEVSRLGAEVRRYSAVLLPEDPIPPSDGTELLDLEWIVDALRRHRQELPQALAMRIGVDPGLQRSR